MRGARPRLRGWLHGATAPFAVAAAWLLHRAVAHLPAPDRLPVLFYGLALIALFATSAVYHIPDGWGPTALGRLLRMDGAATVLLIVGTFVPVAAYALDGVWRRASLLGALAVAVVGVAMATSPRPLSPAASAGGYVLAGWLAAIPVVRIALVLPLQGLVLIVAGGVLYSTGAMVFARRRPDPSPTWFGYHEVFHTLVIAAAALHFAAIWWYVLPLRG